MLFFKAFVFTSQEFQITLNWLIPTTPSLRMIFLVMNQTPMKPVTPSQREQSNPRRHPLSLSAIPRHPLIWVHQWMMRTSYTTSCRMCWPKEMMQVRELVYYSAQIYQYIHTCCRCLNNSFCTCMKTMGNNIGRFLYPPGKSTLSTPHFSYNIT